MSYSERSFDYVTRAKLDSGEIVVYHLCCDLNRFPSNHNVPKHNVKNYEFLGTGTIYSVDGVEHRGIQRHKFYRLRITPLKKEEKPPLKKEEKPFNRYTALTKKNNNRGEPDA